MQSYHSGWYTIFVLNKINLIESFKEYLIGLKDILNFFKSFKIQSQLGSYILLGSLLSPNCFVICFRFSFSTHWLLLIFSLICSHGHYTHSYHHTLAFYIYIYIHTVTCQTTTYSLTRAPQYEDFDLFHWCVCDNCNKSLQCLDVVIGR